MADKSTSTGFIYNAPGAVGVQFDHPCMAPITVVDPATATLRHDAPHRRKIAICGFASSSRHRIPIDDPTWELWAMNQLYRHIPRLDRQFDVHADWRAGNVEGTDHGKWLSEFPGPIYLTETDPAVPHGCRFPLERMIAKFGDYYTSSVAAMLALAIDEIDSHVQDEMQAVTGVLTPWDGAQAVRACYASYTIGVFGIDLIVGKEYDWQKACVEFYLGEANGRGITVYIVPESALLRQQFRYGWEMEPKAIVTLSELNARAEGLAKRKAQAIRRYEALAGVHEFMTVLQEQPVETWPAFVTTQKRATEDASTKTSAELQTLDGAWQESTFIHQVVELRLRGGECVMPTEST